MTLGRGKKFKRSFILLYSVAVLALHCIAVKLVCSRVGILLMANGASKDTTALEDRANLMGQYSGYFTTAFFLLCYGFLILVGILLVINCFSLGEYFGGILFFWLVQGIGILIFLKFINTYGMTELMGRLSFVSRQKLVRQVILGSLILYGLKTFLRKARK